MSLLWWSLSQFQRGPAGFRFTTGRGLRGSQTSFLPPGRRLSAMHTRKHTNSSEPYKNRLDERDEMSDTANTSVLWWLIYLGKSTCTDCTDHLPANHLWSLRKDKIRFVYINVYICVLVTVRGHALEGTFPWCSPEWGSQQAAVWRRDWWFWWSVTGQTSIATFCRSDKASISWLQAEGDDRPGTKSLYQGAGSAKQQ